MIKSSEMKSLKYSLDFEILWAWVTTTHLSERVSAEESVKNKKGVEEIDYHE